MARISGGPVVGGVFPTKEGGNLRRSTPRVTQGEDDKIKYRETFRVGRCTRYTEV